MDISAFDRAAGAYKTPKTRFLQYSLCFVYAKNSLAPVYSPVKYLRHALETAIM